MAKMTPDQEFVEYIVKMMVDHPDDVKTVRTVDEMGVLLTLKLHPEDMGVIIGRQGATARAVRTLLRVIGAKHGARINFKIEEPEGGRGPRRTDDALGAAPAGVKDVDEAIGDLKL